MTRPSSLALLTWIAAGALLATPLMAQSDQDYADVVAEVKAAEAPAALASAKGDARLTIINLLLSEAVTKHMAQAAARRAMAGAAAAETDTVRMFRLNGNSNTTGGSTSVVARTGVADLLAAAVESGAVASKTDQGVATLTLNALALTQLINQTGPTYGCGSLFKIREEFAARQAQASIDSFQVPAVAAVKPAPVERGYCEYGVGRYLRGLSGSISTNINSKQTSIPVLKELPGGQLITDTAAVLQNSGNLAAIAVKYEFYSRESSSEALRTKTAEGAKSLAEKSKGLALKLANAADGIQSVSNYPAWQKAATDQLYEAAKLGVDSLRAEQAAQLAALEPMVLVNAKTLSDFAALKVETDKFTSAILAEAAQRFTKKTFAIDYIHQRPTDQPWLHRIRADVSLPLGGHVASDDPKDMKPSANPWGSLDFNFGVGLYHELQIVGGKDRRLRDIQAAVGLNWKWKSWGNLGSPIFTAAGYWQYMIDNALIKFGSSSFVSVPGNLTLSDKSAEVLNTKGGIGVGQIRLEIPLGKGLSFPLAVSYASRSELIHDPQKKYWQGHIGIHYDFSKLFAKP